MEKENTDLQHTSVFFKEIKEIIVPARGKAYPAINSAIVETYWQMDKRIVEEEKQGKERANYGPRLLKALSKELTKEFGKGWRRKKCPGHYCLMLSAIQISFSALPRSFP